MKRFETCLIYLINFEGINIRPVDYPIVLYRFVKISFYLGKPNDYTFRAPFEMQFVSNLSVEYLKLRTGSLIFWHQSISKTKQWNCEVRLYLYPKDRKTHGKNFNYEYFLNKLEPWSPAFHSQGDQYTALSSSIVDTSARFEVLITREDYQNTEEWVHGVSMCRKG